MSPQISSPDPRDPHTYPPARRVVRSAIIILCLSLSCRCSLRLLELDSTLIKQQSRLCYQHPLPFTMAITIYESDQPAPFLPQISAFDYILPPGPGVSPLPDFSPDLAAFIDGQDGRVLTRGGLRNNALRLAGGLRSLGLKRGDTAAIWGFNSLEWITAAYGCLGGGIVVSPANYG